MSGLTLNTEGDNSDTLIVTRVRPGTPGDRADVRPDDLILSINGTYFQNTSLTQVHDLLRRRSGKKIRLVILRDGKRIIRKFRLERMI